VQQRPLQYLQQQDKQHQLAKPQSLVLFKALLLLQQLQLQLRCLAPLRKRAYLGCGRRSASF
jgi:hypothetical protein